MIVLARICLYQAEAEEAIAVLKSRGFTVLSHVFPDEPDHVFLEATREALTARPGLLTRNEVLSRVLDELADVLPVSSTISEAGPIPVGHKPFQYEGPPWK